MAKAYYNEIDPKAAAWQREYVVELQEEIEILREVWIAVVLCLKPPKDCNDAVVLKRYMKQVVKTADAYESWKDYMKIYTGTCGKDKLKKVIDFNMGIMISPCPTRNPSEGFKKVSCALDNGAFRNWKLGYPFMENLFWETLDKCRRYSIKFDFIVCPDIVTGGKKSLEFSMEWASTKLKTAQNLALAVQDGMTPKDVNTYLLENFTHIFIGGSVEWKWETAKQWVEYAHSKGLKCHIGRCGTLDKLKFSESIGVDSVDSQNFARNDSWGVIDKYHNEKELF